MDGNVLPSINKVSKLYFTLLCLHVPQGTVVRRLVTLTLTHV